MSSPRIKTLPHQILPALRRHRRGLVILSMLLVAGFIAYSATAPLLISTNLVRDKMERAVETWTGHDVRIGGLSNLRFWPRPRITLSDVTVRKDEDGGALVLAHIGEISASFDLLEAIFGRPVFTNFRLDRPEIHLMRNKQGVMDWENDGLLGRALVRTRGGKTLRSRDDAQIGAVHISNGTISFDDETTGKSIHIERMNARIEWPSLSDTASLTSDGVVDGRHFSLSLDAANPLKLMAAQSSQASGSFQSDLFDIRFNGDVDLATHGYLSGTATLSTTSMPDFMHWGGFYLPGMEQFKNVELKADMVAGTDSLRFEQLAMTADDVQGSGRIDIALPADGQPRLTGTLALNSIDLSYVVAHLAPQLIEQASGAGRLRSTMDLDLRISAQNAGWGPFTLSDLALGIMSSSRQARIDILDSDFEGGRLTGRIATMHDDPDGAAAMHIAVTGADFADIYTKLGVTGPLPAGKGSLELSLDAQRPLDAAAWRKAKGTLHFVSDGGVIPGVDIASIRKMAADKQHFALSETGGGAFAFTKFDASADLQDGIAQVNGTIAGGNTLVRLSGVAPYINNSLAISAELSPTGSEPRQNGADPGTLGIFVGGSWPDPTLWRATPTKVSE